VQGTALPADQRALLRALLLARLAQALLAGALLLCTVAGRSVAKKQLTPSDEGEGEKVGDAIG